MGGFALLDAVLYVPALLAALYEILRYFLNRIRGEPISYPGGYSSVRTSNLYKKQYKY